LSTQPFKPLIYVCRCFDVESVKFCCTPFIVAVRAP
jgi:hypothetical protein